MLKMLSREILDTLENVIKNLCTVWLSPERKKNTC